MINPAQQRIDELWDFNDSVASESRFQDALKNCDDVSVRLELRTQIARAQGLQRRFSDAHATLDEIEQALSSHESDPSFADARVRLTLERGRVHNTSGQFDQALPLFDAAHRLAHKTGNDHLAIDAAHMIAIAHQNAGRADDAVTWNERSLRFADKSTQPRGRQWRGSLHNNLGWALHDRGEFAGALSHFENALACRLEAGKPEEIRIARWCVARCLRSLHRFDEALVMQRELLNEINATGQSDGYIHEELGECLLALDRADEAVPHFAEAYRVLSNDLENAASEQPRLNRLAVLGKLR